MCNYNFLSCHFGEVETVERLADSVEYEVCDVYNIVDRTLADGEKEVAKPFRRLFHLDVADCHAGAYLGHPPFVFHVYFHCSVGAVGSERLNRGHADFRHGRFRSFSAALRVKEGPSGRVPRHSGRLRQHDLE